MRLLLSPSLIKRDNSLSVYLDGVQIIEKNSKYGGGSLSFDEVEGGFVQDDVSKFNSEDDATEETEPPVVADER